MTQKDSAWLKNIKKGDTVIVNHRGNFSRESIHEVERLTKTLIILKDTDTRFRKEDGLSYGYCDSWSYRDSLNEGTSEALDIARQQIMKRKIINRLSKTSYSKFSIQSLVKMNDILELEAP